MKRSKGLGLGEWSLIIVYAALLAVCVYLTGTDMNSWLVNGCMFAIVAIIFLTSIFRAFIPVNSLMRTLRYKTKEIRDSANTREMAWNELSQDVESFFYGNKILTPLMKSYVSEVHRLSEANDHSVGTDIEEYINGELVDELIHKNLLDLVSGAMTGLGILGTFIGLTIGLQNFSTGTSEEIESSIAPLMNGIKVAFHTSIYGMVFSLVFNLVYKKKVEDAEDAVEEFLEAFRKNIKPDVVNEEKNRLIAYQEKQSRGIESLNKSFSEQYAQALLDYQKEQTETIRQVSQNVSTEIAEKMTEMMKPEFERINELFTQFSQAVSENQMKGMEGLINEFVTKLNGSLGDNFKELSIVIKETCDYQKANSAFMQDMLTKLDTSCEQISSMNELSQKTIEEMSDYIHEVHRLQEIITDNFKSANTQLQQTADIISRQTEYITNMGNAETLMAQNISAYMTKVQANLETMQTQAESAMKQLTEYAEENHRRITEAAAASSTEIAGVASASGKEISAVAKQQIEEIVQLSGAVSGEIETAAQKLASATTELNVHLDSVLKETFEAFDKNLAEITTHLSGTISEVNETTQRVPKVVGAAYDGMKQEFEAVERQMKQLVQAMQSTRQLIISAAEMQGKTEE